MRPFPRRLSLPISTKSRKSSSRVKEERNRYLCFQVVLYCERYWSVQRIVWKKVKIPIFTISGIHIMYTYLKSLFFWILSENELQQFNQRSLRPGLDTRKRRSWGKRFSRSQRTGEISLELRHRYPSTTRCTKVANISCITRASTKQNIPGGWLWLWVQCSCSSCCCVAWRRSQAERNEVIWNWWKIIHWWNW